VVAVIGFAYWYRRTIIKKAKEEAVAHMEKEGKVSDLIKALREHTFYCASVGKVIKGGVYFYYFKVLGVEPDVILPF